MARTCLQCGVEIRLGALCAEHAAEIATSDDFTAEQIISSQSVTRSSAWLIDQWGTTHVVPPDGMVGRSPADCAVAIMHHTVSSMHAQFLSREGGWQLVDRGSLNGTFVGDRRIRETAIKGGDRLRFGDVSVFFAEELAEPKPAESGPGRTVPSKQKDVAFTATIEGPDCKLELMERPGGGIAKSPGSETMLEFGRLEFALLVVLAARRLKARDPELAFVSSHELADTLEFRSRDADTDNVRELIRRVRKKFQSKGIEAPIESRQGFGYRLGWPIHD